MHDLGYMNGPITSNEEAAANARRKELITIAVSFVDSIRALAPEAHLTDEISLFRTGKDNGCDHEYAELILTIDGSLEIRYTGDYRDHLMKEQKCLPERRSSAPATQMTINGLLGEHTLDHTNWNQATNDVIEEWIRRMRELVRRLSAEAAPNITRGGLLKSIDPDAHSLDPANLVKAQAFLHERGIDTKPIVDTVCRLLMLAKE